MSANPRRTVIGLAMVAVIVSAVIFIVLQSRSHTANSPAGVYFANEETGEISIQSPGAFPPLKDATGKYNLVRAILYSNDGGKTKIAAYYEKYSDAAKAMLDISSRDHSKYDQNLFETGLLVRLPEAGSPWVTAKSETGQQIIAAMPTGGNVTQCSAVLKK